MASFILLSKNFFQKKKKSFGSALFLLMCVIKYLNQFGEFMALVIITSILFASIIYPGMLAAMGSMTNEIRCKKYFSSSCCNRGSSTAEVANDLGGDLEMKPRRKIPKEIQVLNNGSGVNGELSSEEIMNWSKQPGEGGGNDSVSVKASL